MGRVGTLTLEDLQGLARERGGRCVSPRYKSSSHRLQWECAEGHRWRALPYNVKRGTWCPVCARRRQGGNQYTITIGTLRELARSQGGECLSRSYRGPFARYLWRCAAGHEWKAMGDSVRRGSWCPECQWEAQAHSLESMREFAAERGWKCLSDHYETNQTKLRWECSRGHRWEGTFNYVQSRPYCPRCHEHDHRVQGLAACRAIAKSRGGKCLSTDFVGTKYFLDWECSERHRWTARVSQVKQGSWCPECAAIGRRNDPRELQELARSRGGACLTETYIPNGGKVRWRCARGHEWKAVPSSVKTGCWCPVCSRQVRSGHSIEDMQGIAARHGGRCLSSEYRNNRTPLEWECAAGHRWEAPYLAIRGGGWCPECGTAELTGEASQTMEKDEPPGRNRHRRAPGEIDRDLRRIVGERGGKCHTRDIQGRQSLMELECAKGHHWKARVGNILDGSWCHVCGREFSRASWMSRFGLLALGDADEVALPPRPRGRVFRISGNNSRRMWLSHHSHAGSPDRFTRGITRVRPRITRARPNSPEGRRPKRLDIITLHPSARPSGSACPLLTVLGRCESVHGRMNAWDGRCHVGVHGACLSPDRPRVG